MLPLFQRVETLDLKMNFIDKPGFDALAVALREGAAPALKTIDFSLHSPSEMSRYSMDGLVFSDSSALVEACKARGIRGVWMSNKGDMMHT